MASDDRFVNLEDLFSRALEQPHDQRETFLKRRCGEDTELLNDLMSMLRMDARENDILSQPIIDRAVFERFHTASRDRRERAVSQLVDQLETSPNPDALGRIHIYDIMEVIGSGGMGIVFRAIDSRLQRTVAVKVLAPLLAADEVAHDRFMREAQAVAKIKHPHVIAVFSVDEFKEIPYIVMEYIEGTSLDRLIQPDTTVPIEIVIRIGIEIAEGLAAAHAQDLVHRDIKPANILLEGDSRRVVITDFGIARAIHDSRTTRTGQITGTPEYMSPEQAEDQDLDHRADLFSLGSVMYALCAGQPPFRANTPVGVLKRVCHDDPEPLRINDSPASLVLQQTIATLMAKAPEDRYQSAQEVVDRLRSIGPDDGAASPNRTGTKVEFPKQSKRGVILLLAAILVGIISLPILERTGFVDLLGDSSSDMGGVEPNIPIAPAQVSESVFFENLTSSDRQWSEPEKLGPGVNTRFQEGTPFLSDDGLSLYFYSNRPQSGEDPTDENIWVSRRVTTESPFEPAVQLGPTVNTSVDEKEPTVSGDGLTLVFSRRQIGRAGFDLWMSTRASTNAPWGEPTNLGKEINGPHPYNTYPTLSTDGLSLTYMSGVVGGGAWATKEVRRSSKDEQWGEMRTLASGSDITRGGHFYLAAANGLAKVEKSRVDNTRVLFVRPTHQDDWSPLLLVNARLTPPGYNEPGSVFYPFVSADGLWLYYDASLYDEGRIRNIWMIKRIER